MTRGAASRERWDHVTLAVPTFNQAELLQGFLNRFAREAPANLTLHVVNDGSTDGTEHVLKQFGGRPRFKVSHIEHGGAGAARNFAISQCDTQWVAFTDTDVVLTPAFYSGLSSLQEMGREVVAVEGKVIAPSEYKPPLTHWLENLNGGTYATANLAVRLDAIRLVNGFDTSFISNLREDTDLGLRLVRRFGPIPFDPERVVLHPFINRPWRKSMSGAWRKQGQIILTERLLYAKHPSDYKLVRRFPTASETLTWWSKWNMAYHSKIHLRWMLRELWTHPLQTPGTVTSYVLALVLAGWEQIALFLQLRFQGLNRMTGGKP